jgi:putative membrane protein
VQIIPMAEQTSTNAPGLDISTRLAIDRTRAAYERTMMSWIRTGTSLITFGFSIYKFFQIEAPIERQKNYLIGPRGFAFALVGIGLLSLLLATFENRQSIRALGAQYGGKQRSLSVIVAALVGVLGVAALFAMIFRQ